MSDKSKALKIVLRDWRPMPVADRAEGIYLYDTEGKRYIDGTAGNVVVNIGHGVKEVQEAMYRQAQKVSFVPAFAFANQPAIDLADRMAALAPGVMKDACKTWFGVTGTDAGDSAIKLARAYYLEKGESSRHIVISRWMSYHGNSNSASGVHGHTSRRELYSQLYINSPHIPPAYCYRCDFGKTYPDCDLLCARALEKEICRQGAQNVAAFIVEPVGAAMGSVPAPPGYFQIIREICDRFGVLFIADEVITGWGRTGKMWGLDHWDVTPDIIFTAKGMCSGYTPIAATIARDAIWEPLESKGIPFRAGHTFNFNPVSCAGALANLEYLLDHKLWENAESTGKYLHEQGRKLLKHKIVGDVRGLGLTFGVEFVQDKERKTPFPPSLRLSGRMAQAALDRGLVVMPLTGLVNGVAGDGVGLGPPLTITRSQIDDMLEILDEAITAVEQELGDQ